MILRSTTIFSSKLTLTEMSVITLHAHARAGGHVIGAGVHLYNIYVTVPGKRDHLGNFFKIELLLPQGRVGFELQNTLHI